MKISESLGHKLIVALIIFSIGSVGGVIYGALIAIPEIYGKIQLVDQKVDSVEKAADKALSAERDRSTVIDDYSTLWLSKTSDRALDNSSRIKGLETAAGIHHKSHHGNNGP